MASPEEPKGAQAPESGNSSGEAPVAPVYDPMYAAGIASPANTRERIGEPNYFLDLPDRGRLLADEWWGRRDALLQHLGLT